MNAHFNKKFIVLLLLVLVIVLLTSCGASTIPTKKSELKSLYPTSLMSGMDKSYIEGYIWEYVTAEGKHCVAMATVDVHDVAIGQAAVACN